MGLCLLLGCILLVATVVSFPLYRHAAFDRMIQDEFDQYLKHMQIRGLGGTDFRPVFDYVNQLVGQKEFQNLKGMIYFTDGCGSFPEYTPGYETAFVFIDDEYNISISINNESFYLSIKDNNSIHRGIVNIIRYNQIKITNLCHKNVLIWGQIGKLEENDYEIFYASEKPFTGLMTTGKIYLFVFDYINIIKKKEIGLNPYKFIFDLEKPISSKCNGYYHQSLVSKNLNIKKYIFNPTNINAIYYEIIQYGKVFSFFNEMSLEEFIYIFNNNKNYYLNTLIQQINGYLKVNFYMEYQYDLTDKENELVSFIFDESIYSTNYKLAVINQKKHYYFKYYHVKKIKDFNVLFFKENSNISYSLSNNDNIK